jgi:aspartate/methionine/tyrosine aminotransferase
MTNNTPIDYNVVKQMIAETGISCIGNASIRELVKIVNKIEAKTGQKFIRMEMGVPGLNPPEIGTQAEIEALKNGVASKYPMIEGIPVLKHELKRFVKNFLNLHVDESHCVPSVGSMQGGMAAFLTAGRRDKKKDTVLFIDPGFPVQKMQLDVLGLKYKTFDVYNFRGDKLKGKLETFLKQGNISCIIYSNPNNPSWICFTEKELQIIAELSNQYETIVIEDLAYFAMDFRKDYSRPGQPPYQPTVGRFTDNYIILFSSSKAFSYAGQRIASIIVSPALFNKEYPDLKRFFTSPKLGHAIIYGALYTLSSGTAHSGQYAFASMLKHANDGTFNFVDYVKVYGERAKSMKKLFVDNGFTIVYDKDEDEVVADGFYFTLSYPGMDGAELVEKLLYYGISAICLKLTGSERTEGLRACVSQTHESQFPDLEYRLKCFRADHPVD